MAQICIHNHENGPRGMAKAINNRWCKPPIGLSHNHPRPQKFRLLYRFKEAILAIIIHEQDLAIQIAGFPG